MAMPRSNAAGVNATGSVRGGGSVIEVANETRGIRDVWAFNLDQELRTIGRVVQRYKFVAMDTEFPGVALKVMGDFHSRVEYHYKSLCCNVSMLNIIQIGFTFMDEAGNKPSNICTWQFNFKFSLTEDMYAQDSINLLINSGIQFERHEKDGIDPVKFAQLFTVSGVVLSDEVKLICFHGAYDMAYLLKVLTNQPLPEERSQFIELTKIYFPVVYDVQYLVQTCTNLTGGLKTLADKLGLEEVGTRHQAGSDSLLTGEVFFKIREIFLEGEITNPNLCGPLVGLGAW
ncbi:hypothetical protein HPB48_018089 [Haemaphysalis longicornis]|uniref:poly(A)-specific ribonuclease n=1 Tax=Haemaphysalis longicornis TaxID=44386 RepID=A0A9J6FVU5_HAELO|nr:hypothetical protein HPB48_018089 [Haemaphysalis longicornis]